MPEEQRRKISEAQIGRTFSEEHRRNMSIAGTGHIVPEETRKKISETMKKGVYHHTKYIEIHGVDEGVVMSASEHKRTHARLRREGKCNIPSNMLKKVSQAAHHRYVKGRTS